MAHEKEWEASQSMHMNPRRQGMCYTPRIGANKTRQCTVRNWIFYARTHGMFLIVVKKQKRRARRGGRGSGGEREGERYDQGAGVGEEEEDTGETVEKILAEQSSDSDWAEEEEDYAKVFVVKFEDGNALRKEDFLSGI